MNTPKTRPVPIRRCTACGKQDAKGTMLRVARSSEGLVAVDPKGKAPGRGAYVCPEAACFEQGVRRGRLEHTLKVKLSPEERAKLFEDLKAAASTPLMMARRSSSF